MKLFLKVIVFLVLYGPLFAVDWSGSTSPYNWAVDSNWGGNPYPNGAAENATFPAGISNDPRLNANIELGDIVFNVNGNAQFWIDGSNTLTINDSITFNGNGRLLFGQLNTIDLSFPTGITVDMSPAADATTKMTFDTVNTATGSISLTGPGIFDILADSSGCITGAPTYTLTGSAQIIFSSSLMFGLSNLALGDGCSLLTISAPSESITTNITGTGSVTWDPQSILVVVGTNTYSGGTVLSGGTLIGSTTSIPSGSGFTNNGAVTFNQSSNGTFSSVISGTGSITKSGSANLIFTADNTYSGITTISAGKIQLSGASGSIAESSELTLTGTAAFEIVAGSGTKTIQYINASSETQLATSILLNDNTLNINSGGFRGAITGTGGITKLTSGTLTLSGTNTYTGQTKVSAGTLAITGSLQSATLVEANGTLMGTGTIKTTTNQGNVSPGASIGTLTIDGNYSQSSGGNLNIEINPDGTSDLLDISGTASLAGSVTVLPEAGAYLEGASFTILTADGGLGGTTFTSLIETHPLDFHLQYSATTVLLVVGRSGVVPPIPTDELTGNAKKVADYVFCYASSDPHLITLQTQLATLSIPAYPTDLVELSPANFGAFSLVGLQNNIFLADALSQKAIYSLCNCTSNNKDKSPFYWVTPTGFLYKQNSTQDQIGFNLYTYGAAGGFAIPLSESGLVTLGAGYTHSNLFWKLDGGSAESNTVYASPTIGASGGSAYINLMIQGSIDFYQVKRHVHFGSINTNAYNHHKSYNTLCRLDIGGKFVAAEADNTYIQPEISLNYLNLFEESYSEKGASNFINLAIRHKLSVFLQPNGGVRFSKEFNKKSFCFMPNLYIGWLANIPMTDGFYTARMYEMDIPCHSNFKVLSYHQVTNQLSLSGEFLVKKCDQLVFRAGYKADFLSHFLIQAVYLKLNVNF